MTEAVDPSRLTELRKRRRLTQEALAKQAGVSKQTVYRLEKGQQSGNRQKSVKGLCEALGVDADVLSGQAPLPPSDRPSSEPSDDSRYQLNVRLDGAVRNAFSLVALRYKIPISRIVELAPLLFVLAAERSLDRRRANLVKLVALFAQGDELRRNFWHLPDSIMRGFEADRAIEEEAKSIENLDIFGLAISDDIFNGEVYDEAEDNPFVAWLKEQLDERKDIAEVSYFDRGSTSYRVCRRDASVLTGGDQEFAERILEGWVLLHEMPRELLEKGATSARTEWLRAKLEAVREEARRGFEELSPKKLEEILQGFETNLNEEGAQL
jgi:transcriptional regulator with XRE-family HTH domain